MAIAELVPDPDDTLLRQLQHAKKVISAVARSPECVKTQDDLCSAEQSTYASGDSPVPSLSQDPAVSAEGAQALEQAAEKTLLAEPGATNESHQEDKAQRLFCTDAEISSGAHVTQERELEQWKPDVPDSGTTAVVLEEEPSRLADGGGEEWDQFRTNYELFGVVSTFKDDLSQYTTPLDISKVPPELRKRAARVASDIESSKGGRSSRSGSEEEPCSDDDGDEEARWSAVPRNSATQNKGRSNRSRHSRKASDCSSYGTRTDEQDSAASPQLSHSSIAPPDPKDDVESAAPKVHGTFRLIDGVGLVEECVAQSMPWMAGQSSWDQSTWVASSGAHMYPSVTPVTIPDVSQAPRLMPGAEVLVEGLTKAPAFNGLSGIVQSFDTHALRYNVLLFFQDGSQQLAKIKDENLRMINPWIVPQYYQYQ